MDAGAVEIVRPRSWRLHLRHGVGGGPYYVVESDRWAADSVQELYDVIAQVVGMMPQADDKIKLHGPYTPPKDAP